TTPSAEQQNSGVTAELTGILGTFDLAVDAFGLRVAALEVEIPDVVTVTAEGIVIQYDPDADR
ncbi:hypothetical protein D3OALGB2SA_4230, partial [Olavius algarvensis associated proteobacterium Delta 3]